MLKLSGSEIDFYASKIYETLEEIPLYYIEEIMELAFEEENTSSSDDN